jgi:hypothetical protein
MRLLISSEAEPLGCFFSELFVVATSE